MPDNLTDFMSAPSMPLCYNEQKNFAFPLAHGAAYNARVSTTSKGVRGRPDYLSSENAVPHSDDAEHDDKKLLEALRCSKLYREYERTFTEATGLPLAVRPLEFFGLPLHAAEVMECEAAAQASVEFHPAV